MDAEFFPELVDVLLFEPVDGGLFVPLGLDADFPFEDCSFPLVLLFVVVEEDDLPVIFMPYIFPIILGGIIAYRIYVMIANL